MSIITITDLYDVLSEKIGKTEAKALTNYIEQKIEHDLEVKTNSLATKEDLSLVRVDLEKGFKEQTRWMLGVFITLAIMILGLYAGVFLKN